MHLSSRLFNCASLIRVNIDELDEIDPSEGVWALSNKPLLDKLCLIVTAEAREVTVRDLPALYAVLGNDRTIPKLVHVATASRCIRSFNQEDQ